MQQQLLVRGQVPRQRQAQGTCWQCGQQRAQWSSPMQGWWKLQTKHSRGEAALQQATMAVSIVQCEQTSSLHVAAGLGFLTGRNSSSQSLLRLLRTAHWANWMFST